MELVFRIFITLYAVMFSTLVFAKDSSELAPRCGQTNFNLCGFIDVKLSKKKKEKVFVIEPIYEDARHFSEGFAAVRIEGKYGFIDETGYLIIKPKFDSVTKFYQGLAAVNEAGVVGIIDKSGNYVVEPMFSRALIFSDKVILGAPIEDTEYGSANYRDYSIDKAKIYNLATGWVTEKTYTFERFSDPQQGLIWAQVPNETPGDWDDLYGLMRIDGTWLIEPKFRYVNELAYNRAIVRDVYANGGKSGAIDGAGRQVIPFKFDYLTAWDKHTLKAGQGDYPNRKWGLVTFDGTLLADRYFDEIEQMENYHGPDHPPQDFYSVKDGDDWKSLLKDGTLLSDQRAGQVFLACDQFKIHYDVNGYRLVPKDKALSTVKFDDTLFSYLNQTCSPPPTIVRRENYATILENGSVFGGFFENSQNFFGTHLWVSVDKKWGLVAADGEFAIKPIYDFIQSETIIPNGNDVPELTTDRTYKVTQGDTVYRLSFKDEIYHQELFSEKKEDLSKRLFCKGGFKRKSKNGLWGIIDEKGDYLLPPQYRAITCFHSGVAWVPDDTKRQWCPVDQNNRVRSAPACEATYYSSFISHHSPEEFDDDPYESSVLWMRAMLDYREGRRDEAPRMIPWD